MVSPTSKWAYLMLSNGTLFKGKAVGKIGTTMGEIAFNTSMTGYQEIFTDPSYFGQIILMTNNHIGNYGVFDEDMESDSVKINGLICKKFSDKFSRKMGQSSLDSYFMDNGIVGISDVDTREIAILIRELGAMNVIISSEIEDPSLLAQKLKECPNMSGLELASKVSTTTPYTLGNPNASIHIALIDFGTKRNIALSLVNRGAYVKVFPYNTTPAQILEFKPNGILLSNGPGDPSSMHQTISNIKELIQTNTPIFGICLGHQLLALAAGLKTYKMQNGHRGSNHPVKNLLTNRSEITAQNHGFAVEFNTNLKDQIQLTHINLNDNTVEGIKLLNHPAFSVQHHPEANPGPHDSWYAFDDFINLITQHQNQTA